MKAFASFLVVLALAAPLSSCAPSFDTPPDLQPLLQAYENPTAVVTSEIMAKVADEIAKAAEEIQNSEIFEEILQVIIDVQQELDAATVKTCEDGDNKGNDCVDDTDCPGSTCVSTGTSFSVRLAKMEPTKAMSASTIRIVRAFAMVEPTKVVNAPPIRIVRAVALAVALAVVEWSSQLPRGRSRSTTSAQAGT